MVRTDLQTIGNTIQQKQLSELPLATRSIDGLIALAAGASTTGNNPRISGSNYWGGNNFTSERRSVNDPGNGGAAYSSGVAGLGCEHARARQPAGIQDRQRKSERRIPGGRDRHHGDKGRRERFPSAWPTSICRTPPSTRISFC